MSSRPDHTVGYRMSKVLLQKIWKLNTCPSSTPQSFYIHLSKQKNSPKTSTDTKLSQPYHKGKNQKTTATIRFWGVFSLTSLPKAPFLDGFPCHLPPLAARPEAPCGAGPRKAPAKRRAEAPTAQGDAEAADCGGGTNHTANEVRNWVTWSTWLPNWLKWRMLSW